MKATATPFEFALYRLFLKSIELITIAQAILALDSFYVLRRSAYCTGHSAGSPCRGNFPASPESPLKVKIAAQNDSWRKVRTASKRMRNQRVQAGIYPRRNGFSGKVRRRELAAWSE